MMKPLPRTTPAACDVDSVGIGDLLDALESTPGIDPHSVMLLRHGQVIAEGWWQPYSAEGVHLLYSLSKIFTSTAVGLAVAEGLVDLDVPVLQYFPELDGEITDRRSRSMLVRHVAAMASGHLEETLEQADALDPDDLLRGFLLIPPDAEPGSIFAYNQPCTFALAAIVQRVSGESLTDFLRPRLFDPLGIDELGWERDAAGREIGWSGLYAPTEAVAKLGQLYLQGGHWEGRQLLDREWVEEATRRHIDTPADREPDWRLGYGFQFWISRFGYRGDGAFGQFCLILPDVDVVLAVTSQVADMQKVLDLVWEHLLPALHTKSVVGTRTATDVDAALAARLSSLRLPAPTGGAFPVGMASHLFLAEEGNDQPGLTEVLLDDDADGNLTLTLREGASLIVAEVGVGRWITTGAVAVSGAWCAPGDAAAWRVLVDVVFVETPHRLRLTCRPDTGTFRSRWVTAPLRSPPLGRLRMPVRGGR